MSDIGPKTWKELKEYIREDTERGERFRFKTFAARYALEAGFKYVFWMRLTRYFYLKGKKAFVPYALCRARLKHYGYKYSFDISYHAQIGKGLYIAHYGYIVIPTGTVMGECCRLRPGVIVGTSFTHGESGGTVIGDRVEFGVGSKVIGAERIGNDVVIGANAVVTKSVPDRAVVAGIPAKVLRIQE